MPTRRDLFISHASEDKDAFVRPLASALQKLGCSVWYDEFELKAGDSLSEAIDEGISIANYGLVILSRNFFEKPWTKEELRGLRSLERAKLSKIIPVWLEVSQEDVLRFSAPLADKLAIVAKPGDDISDIAIEVIKVAKPSLLEFMHLNQRVMHTLQSKKAEPIELSQIKKGPIQHEKLSFQVLSRIRLLQAIFDGAHPCTLEQWIDDFSRDIHPHRELIWWEFLAESYIKMREILQGHISDKDIYGALFSSFTGNVDKDFFSALESKDFPENLRNMAHKFLEETFALFRSLFGDEEILREALHPAPEDF